MILTTGALGKKVIDVLFQPIRVSLQEPVDRLDERDLGKEYCDDSSNECATKSDNSVPRVLGLNVINLFGQLLKLVHEMILQHLAVGRNLLKSHPSFHENFKHKGVCMLLLLPVACEFIEACNLFLSDRFVFEVKLALFGEIEMRVDDNFNLCQAGYLFGVDVVLFPQAPKY